MAKEVTKRMGIKLKLQPINWDSKDQELAGKDHRLYLERTDIQRRQGKRDALF